MENVSGEQGVKELIEQGIPVEYLEGDGDNMLKARIKGNLNLTLKKRFDKNYIVKNVGKWLYQLASEKRLKLSKYVKIHIEKCLKYVFLKKPRRFKWNGGKSKGSYSTSVWGSLLLSAKILWIQKKARREIPPQKLAI